MVVNSSSSSCRISDFRFSAYSTDSSKSLATDSDTGADMDTITGVDMGNATGVSKRTFSSLGVLTKSILTNGFGRQLLLLSSFKLFLPVSFSTVKAEIVEMTDVLFRSKSKSDSGSCFSNCDFEFVDLDSDTDCSFIDRVA